MDGYHQHEKGGEFVTYARLRAMGTNGFQEPAVGLEGGPVGTGSSPGGTTTGQQPGMVVQGPAIEGARGKEPVQQATAGSAAAPAPTGGSRAHHRHEAALRGRQVQHEGRQGRLHGDAMARLAGRGQAGGEGQVRLPDQQRAHQPRLAERLSRPGERSRHGPLAVPVHRDEPAGHGGAQPEAGRPRRGLQRQRLDAGDGLSDANGPSRSRPSCSSPTRWASRATWSRPG